VKDRETGEEEEEISVAIEGAFVSAIISYMISISSAVH